MGKKISSIRSARDDEKYTILKWRNMPHVRDAMLTSHEISIDEHDKWWDKIQNSETDEVLIFDREGDAVGVITLFDIDNTEQTAWWGFYLRADLDPFQNTEVWISLESEFIEHIRNTTKLREIYCETKISNEIAWRLHERVGFVDCQTERGLQENLKIMKYKFSRKPTVYLFGSYNLDFLVRNLSDTLEDYPNFPFSIGSTAFGRYQFDLRDDKNIINDADNAYIFLERIEDFLQSSSQLPTYENICNLEAQLIDYIDLIRHISNRGHHVFVADFEIHVPLVQANDKCRSGSALRQLLIKYNDMLYNMADDNNVYIIPYAALLLRHGSGFSNKFWHLARAPFGQNFMAKYSYKIIGTVLSAFGLTARALVLDLDNTLWGGVIGDDGIDGIRLGGDFPGNVFVQLQGLFSQLSSDGIPLTLCSKNTENIAMQAINNHPEMIITGKDIVASRINWEPKSKNILDLADELNLGTASLCFIDDNPVERSEVRGGISEIYVPELPEDIVDWYDFICDLPELTRNKVTRADKGKVESYKSRARILSAEKIFSNRVDFIASLNINIEISLLNDTNMDRSFELFTKTNQFNTTTIRYTKSELYDAQNSLSSKVLFIRTKDKFSTDYEGISCLYLSQIGSDLVIENFVMSCRVMGRDIEKAVLCSIINAAKKSNFKRLVGKYTPSDKNIPVPLMYEENEFVLKDGEFVFDLKNTCNLDVLKIVNVSILSEIIQ